MLTSIMWAAPSISLYLKGISPVSSFHLSNKKLLAARNWLFTSYPTLPIDIAAKILSHNPKVINFSSLIYCLLACPLILTS